MFTRQSRLSAKITAEIKYLPLSAFFTDRFGAGLALDPRRDDLRPGLRIFSPRSPARRYVICYYSTVSGIEIGHVFHGSQDWVALIASE